MYRRLFPCLLDPRWHGGGLLDAATGSRARPRSKVETVSDELSQEPSGKEHMTSVLREQEDRNGGVRRRAGLNPLEDESLQLKQLLVDAIPRPRGHEGR